MIDVRPVALTDGRIRLEPMSLDHVDALKAAAADGQLWNLRVTSVPAPEDTQGYVERALAMKDRLPFVVVDLENGNRIVGSTSYHDIVPAIDRVEIGWTWYAARWQRSHVNSACKLLLMTHAFETLGCRVVGLRTDNFNFRSQRAIEAIGGKRDGVIRHHYRRRDGSVRDTVMYSILATEWPDVKKHLTLRVARLAR